MNTNDVALRAADFLDGLLCGGAPNEELAASLCARNSEIVCRRMTDGDTEMAALITAYLTAAALVTVEGNPSSVRAGEFSAEGSGAAVRAAELRAEAERLCAPYCAPPIEWMEG